LFLQLHRDLARKTVQKSLVLLKNGKDPSKPFLPLNRNAKRVLVAGTHAHDIGYQCGGWIGTKYESSGQITIGKPMFVLFPTLYMFIRSSILMQLWILEEFMF